MLVINRLDADNIHFDVLLKAIQDSFGKACVLFNAPVGIGADFKGVVSVLEPPDSMPVGCPVDVASIRSKLVDAIVEADESLMEKYLMEGAVSGAELKAAMPKALAAGTVIPIFCTSAKKDIGIAELLDAISNLALSPLEAKPRVAVKGSGDKAVEVTLEAKEPGAFGGQIFKNLNDKFV